MNRPALAPFSALLLAMALPSIAFGAPPGAGWSQLLACRHITADAARLACFDRASALVARASAPASSGQSAPQPTPAMKAALDPQRTFGLPRGTIVQREAAAAGIHVKSVSNITAHIVGMRQGPDGRAIIALDNGQVWEQLVADGDDLHAKPGDSVQISRGWLDSYWLEAPSHHGYKVTRLR